MKHRLGLEIEELCDGNLLFNHGYFGILGRNPSVAPIGISRTKKLDIALSNPVHLVERGFDLRPILYDYHEAS